MLQVKAPWNQLFQEKATSLSVNMLALTSALQ